MKRVLVIASLVVSVSVGVFGELPSETADSSREIEDAIRLMEVSGMSESTVEFGANVGVNVMREGLKDAELPEEFFAVAREETVAVMYENLDELHREIAPIYLKYLTHSEILAAIDYYETPEGQRALEVLPDLMTECYEAGKQWGRRIGPELSDRLLERLYDEGFLPTDPAAESDLTSQEEIGETKNLDDISHSPQGEDELGIASSAVDPTDLDLENQSEEFKNVYYWLTTTAKPEEYLSLGAHAAEDVLIAEFMELEFEEYGEEYDEEYNRATEELSDAMKTYLGSLLERIVRIYLNTFSSEEISTYREFSDSPEGKKLVASTPTLTAEITEAGRQWGYEIAPGLAKEIVKRVHRDPNDAEGVGIEPETEE